MGRKSIYSQEFKIKCVQDHIDGLPYSQIIKENGLSKNDLKTKNRSTNRNQPRSGLSLQNKEREARDFLFMVTICAQITN